MKFGSRMDVFVPPEVRARGDQGQARRRGRDGAGSLPGGGPVVSGDAASGGDLGGATAWPARLRLVSATGARVIPLAGSTRASAPGPRCRASSPSATCSAASPRCCCRSRATSARRRSLVGISIVLDIGDGAVARAVGAITPFGLQFDSLADLISFGIAPAVLVYTWALPAYPVWAWAGAMFWLACAAYRLARFNVTIDPLADKRYFVGLASPGAAGVVIATVLALDAPHYARTGPCCLVPLAVSVVPALLMVIRCGSARSATCSRRGT